MLKYQIKHRALGNSVAEHTESFFECDNCNGTGEIAINKADLIDRMEGRDYATAIRMYRDWKNNNHIVGCPECDGMGYWVDRS